MTDASTGVLVVGAGPTGLTLANVLAHAGVPVTVLDRKPGPVTESRAALVHTRTLELWDRWGLARPAIDAGTRVERVSMRAAGAELASFPIADVEPSPFAFALALPQSETERLLLDRLPIRPEWNTELVGYTSHADGVTAVIRLPDGSLNEIFAQYLVGTDGAHSLVRRLTGIRAAASGRAPTAFLADVRLSPAPPSGEVELNLARGGFVGVLGLGDDWYRLFGALQPEHARRFGSGPGLADLQELFAEHFRLPVRPTEAGWTAIYRIRHQVAENFRAGRAFLAGDAAHIHAPAGGQGMNLGVGDAVNLGWKLALVLQGLAGEELLGTYETERRRIARKVSRGADRGFALETTANGALDWARRKLVPPLIRGASRLPAAHRAVYQLFSQTWITYRTHRRGTPSPGDRAPDGPLTTTTSLYDALAEPVHHLLLLGGREHEDAARSLIDSYRIPIRLHLTESAELRRSYGADTPLAVLIRPDAHLAALAPASDLTALKDHLTTWYR